MKRKKFPKKPKSKSLAAWERYDNAMKAVVKHNQGIEAAKKKIESIKKKYS
jgi:hypothetical protein